MSSASEILDFFEAGEIIIFRKPKITDEYVKLSKERLILGDREPRNLRVLWGLYIHEDKSGRALKIPYAEPIKTLLPFARQWNEVIESRGWNLISSKHISIREIVEVVNTILDSEGWRIYFEVPGKSIEESKPLPSKREDMILGGDDYES